MLRPFEPEYYGAVKFILSEHSWQYRGEGNANIAISLPREKKIILLPKSDRNYEPDVSEFWCNMKINVAFISSIMKPLLGKQFVSCPSLIYLECDDIAELNRTLATIRPENRLHKILSFCGAELYDDFSFLPKEISQLAQKITVSIELKPKQGVFPWVEMKNRNCLFCCKQELKLKDGHASKRSKYCPLDLFSGDHVRMEHAVKSLFKTPQNNLRIFYDGNVVFDDSSSSDLLEKILADWLQPVSRSTLMERFCSLLLQALTRDMTSSFIPSQESTQKWVFDGVSPSDTSNHPTKFKRDEIHEICQNTSCLPCNYDRQALPQGSILYALAEAQALDQFGNDEVLDMVRYSRDLSCASNQDSKIGVEYVQDVIEKGCSSRLNAIELYLIASVVRDCSILITLQEMQKHVHESFSLPWIEDAQTKTIYLLKISAIDINPKPFSTIASHASRNKKILQAIGSTQSSTV